MKALTFMITRTATSNTSIATDGTQEELNGPTSRPDGSQDSLDTEHKVETFLINTPQEARGLLQLVDSVDDAKTRLILAAGLFGPPRVSLDWKDRCNLMWTLQRTPRLTHITFQGTTMGQVLSCDLLSQGFPPTLESLKVNAGLILDDTEGISKLAKALRQLPHLRDLCFFNFLNHVRVTTSVAADSTKLMDPIVVALTEFCPNLRKLEFSCLASFMEWNEPFLSISALYRLLEKCSSLKHLELTHLNLGDGELGAISDHRSSRLSRLILNANENSAKGLARVILGSCRIGSSITHLECINHVKLTEDMYDYLLWYTSLRHANCPLRHFQATLPLRLDHTLLQRQLRLQKLELVSHFYAPHISNSVASTILSRVADDPTCIYRLLQERPTMLCVGGSGPDETANCINPKLITRAVSLLVHILKSGVGGFVKRNEDNRDEFFRSILVHLSVAILFFPLIFSSLNIG